MALWDITEREDRWIVENQVGILSSAYTPGRYAISEGASKVHPGVHDGSVQTARLKPSR